MGGGSHDRCRRRCVATRSRFRPLQLTGTPMTVLTRELLHTGAYLRNYETLPNELRWSAQRIEQSLAETLADHRGGDIWLFAYGSLIWNPLLKFSTWQWAMLNGWHRGFCLRMVAGRASPDKPGRMLGLEPGEQTQGRAFRIAAGDVRRELSLIWTREMATGAYRPHWVPIRLIDGSTARAITFVADPAHALFECDAEVDEIAPQIAIANGPLGSNAEYLFQLESALARMKTPEPSIVALADAVRACLIDRRS